MTLRTRTLLIVGLAFVASIVVAYVMFSTVLLDGAAASETLSMEQNVQRALDTLDEQIAGLDKTTGDYAAWDESYAFVEDGDPAFVEDNLAVETFLLNDLSLIAFVQNSGQVTFAKAVDANEEAEVPVPDDLGLFLAADSVLLQHADPEGHVTGILMLRDGPMLVASRPILTGARQGPIHGALIMGRRLDDNLTARLAQLTHLDVMLQNWGSPDLPADFDQAASSLSAQAPIYVHPLSAESIAGYAVLDDIRGQPAILLRTVAPRPIYQQGLTSAQTSLVLLLAVGLMFALLILWLLERLVLRRLARLNRVVGRLADDSAPTTALSTVQDELEHVTRTESGDEIGALARSFARLTSQLSSTIDSLDERVQERTSQLQSTVEVSRSLTSVLDPDALIGQVVQLITDRLDFYYAAVFLVDASGKYAVLREASGSAGKLLKESGHRLEVGGHNMVGAAIAMRRPRMAGRVADEPLRYVNPLLPDTRSEAALPLIVGEDVLGALDVQSAQPDVFDDNTVAILQSLADQIAIALNNARLFQSAQRDARQATALFEASRLASFVGADLATAAQQLLDTIAQQADFDRWQAATFDPDTNTYTVVAGRDDANSEPSLPPGQALPIAQPPELPIARTMRLRRTLVIGDPATDPYAAELPPHLQASAANLVCAPAVLNDEVVGAVSLGRSAGDAAISQRDRQLAEAIANQLAMTIQNRRLFDQSQRTTAELNTLMQRYTREGWTRFTQAQPRHIAHEFSRPGAPPLASGVLPELDQAARDETVSPVHFGDQAAVALPITLRGEVIGTLGVQDDQNRRWTVDELATLKAVADQVAQSIEVARLLDETEASLQETSVLYQASRSIAAATTPSEVMNIVVRTIHSWLQVDQVRLVLFDAERMHGTIEAEAVPSTDAASLRIPMAGNPLYDELDAARRPIAIADATQDSRVSAIDQLMQQFGVRGVLLLPLLVGQRLIGIIAIGTYKPRRMLDNEIAFCETLARQSAAAVENRRLFEETQRRAEIEAALNQINQTIKASLDPQAVLDLQTTVAEMGRVMHASRSYFMANDDDQRFIYAYEWCAEDARSFKGASGSWTDLPQTFRALKAGRPLVTCSVSQEDAPELQPLMQAHAVRSHVHVPVLVGTRLIGVLGFDQVDRERRWLPEEVNLVQRVADQLAAALENARLYQNVRSRVNELTALTRIGRRLTSTLQLEDVLNTIVEEALNVTPADRGTIALYDADQDALEVRVMIGYPETARQHILDSGFNWLRREDGLHGRLLTTGEAVLSNDVQKDGAYISVDTDTRSELIVPIRHGDALLGALNLESPHTYAFGDSDQRLIEALADQAAVAIANARAYESERTALERMREVDRLKTQFLANMSHELRTPLNSIIGFSRVILRGIDGPLTDLQQADLTAIHNSGQHLLGLINDILDLSKIEAGKMELSLEDMDLSDVIKGVMSTAIALVKDKKVELRTELPPELPTVRADSRRIRQVVLNLVSNASKFTESGRITTRVVVYPREVHVLVNDTGIGIPDDKLAHIFEEFTQVDASTTRKAGGTGLGLAISRRFVEMHGGRMWVESQLDAGSTFAFSLPLQAPVETAEEVPTVELPAADMRLKRILCIDDDPSVITLYQRYLEKQGYQVVGLQDSHRAVEEAQRLQPAAITLDVLMPNHDGWSVLAELKTTPETSHIPIIVCSILEDESKGFALGAADYLVKPISEGDLMRALDHVNGQRPIRSVLVIDDEADAVRLIRRMLEGRPGLQVSEAQGGAQGVANVQARRPDVVLLDLMMPDMDGFAVLETIKSNRLTRDIPVIIVTAKELTEDDRERLLGKAAALLNKGAFSSERLLNEIGAALAQIEKSRHSSNGTQSQPATEAETV